MLEAAGIPFETAETDFDEDGVKASLRARGIGAADLALALASEKALAVPADGDEIVLGSDQTLEFEDGSMLDRAASREELSEQLRRLSGRTHRLHTAAAIVQDGAQLWSEIETVTMQMRPLGAEFIRDYVAREYETVRWSVGGYHVEGSGAQLFERIEGSLFAVQGLPLLPLLEFLRGRGLLPS
jgi:septum formation protein